MISLSPLLDRLLPLRIPGLALVKTLAFQDQRSLRHSLPTTECEVVMAEIPLSLS